MTTKKSYILHESNNSSFLSIARATLLNRFLAFMSDMAGGICGMLFIASIIMASPLLVFEGSETPSWLQNLAVICASIWFIVIPLIAIIGQLFSLRDIDINNSTVKDVFHKRFYGSLYIDDSLGRSILAIESGNSDDNDFRNLAMKKAELDSQLEEFLFQESLERKKENLKEANKKARKIENAMR